MNTGTGSRARSCATRSMNASARLDPDRAAAALVCCGGAGRDVDGTYYLVAVSAAEKVVVRIACLKCILVTHTCFE
jgi:hypothetical protein